MDPDPTGTNYFLQIFLIVVLIGINAFFAAAEMAIVSISRTKVKTMAADGNKKALRLEKLLEDESKFLSTIQVAITLSGFLASATTASELSIDLSRYLTFPYAQEVMMVLLTLALSYFTLVLGELVPKRIALQQPEKVAFGVVGVVSVVKFLFTPFVWLLSVSTNGILRLLGLKTSSTEENLSKEEIQSIVEASQESGVLNETEKDMINGIFEFDVKTAEEVMTPRTEVFAIDIDEPLESYLDDLLNEKYSRIPVYQNDIDHIVGVLYMKDFMLQARNVGFEHVDVRACMQKPYLVPERKNIDELFKELQAAKTHMAILIDEYGGFSGIVTIEDLIEEIMGDIDDEYDDEDPDIRVLDDHTYLVQGSVSIQSLNDELDLDLDGDSDDYDTVSGLVIHLMGYIPSPGEKAHIEYGNCAFELDKVGDKRIESLKLIKMPVTENVNE